MGCCEDLFIILKKDIVEEHHLGFVWNLKSKFLLLLSSSRGPLSGVGLPGFWGGFGLARGVWSGFFLICVG
jgi:hypothetical protein